MFVPLIYSIYAMSYMFLKIFFVFIHTINKHKTIYYTFHTST